MSATARQTVAEAYLTTDEPLKSIADKLGLTLKQLVEMLREPESARLLDALIALVEFRARFRALDSRPAALSTLNDICLSKADPVERRRAATSILRAIDQVSRAQERAGAKPGVSRPPAHQSVASKPEQGPAAMPVAVPQAARRPQCAPRSDGRDGALRNGGTARSAAECLPPMPSSPTPTEVPTRIPIEVPTEPLPPILPPVPPPVPSETSRNTRAVRREKRQRRSPADLVARSGAPPLIDSS